MADFFFALYLMTVFFGFMLVMMFLHVKKSGDAEFPSLGKLVAFAILGVTYTVLSPILLPATAIIWALNKTDVL